MFPWVDRRWSRRDASGRKTNRHTALIIELLGRVKVQGVEGNYPAKAFLGDILQAVGQPGIRHSKDDRAVALNENVLGLLRRRSLRPYSGRAIARGFARRGFIGWHRLVGGFGLLRRGSGGRFGRIHRNRDINPAIDEGNYKAAHTTAAAFAGVGM